MKSEKELQKELFEKLKKLDCIGDHYIDMEVPIPYKHIYLPGKVPNLEVWCFKQDIAIYDILFNKSVAYKAAHMIDQQEIVVEVTLEKDNAQKTHHVGLPYVIIETKKQQPDTHTLLAYSEKVKMLKTIFPYCKYIFVVFDRISPRTYRHGINFDEILHINIESKKSFSLLEGLIDKYLTESKTNIDNIKANTKVRHSDYA